jgi:hypothetical protein
VLQALGVDLGLSERRIKRRRRSGAMGRDRKIVSSGRQSRVIGGSHVKIVVEFGLGGESEDAIGVLRIVNNGPRAFNNYKDFFHSRSLGLGRGWRCWRLGLLTRDEE